MNQRKTLLLTAALVVIAVFAFALRHRYASPAYPKRNEVVNEALALIEAHSISRPGDDWAEIGQTTLALANDGGRERDLDNALRYLIGRLNDGHSFYLDPAEAAVVRAPADAASATAIARVLPSANGFAVVRLQAFGSIDASKGERAATQLRKLILNALAVSPCGLVVDLTENSGGNMYPMFSGVLPLFPQGDLFSFESVDSNRAVVRRVGARLLLDDAEIYPSLSTLLPSTEALPKVAWLIGPSTASSGEMLAIAAMGRPNMRSFGSASAGRTTANTPFPLANGGLLALSTARALDHVGHRVTGPVRPDEVLPLESAASDALSKAVAWLVGQCSGVVSR